MEVYNKTNGHCAYCGCKIEYKDMQADHYKSLMHGGEDEINNMLPSCRSCNHYKGPCEIETFRKSIERFPKVLNRDNVTYKNAVRYGLVIPNPKSVTFYYEKLGIEIGDTA